MWAAMNKGTKGMRKAAFKIATKLDPDHDDIKAWARVEKRVREAVALNRERQPEQGGITVEEEVMRVLLVARCVDVAHRAVTPMYMLASSTRKLLEHFGLEDELEITIHVHTVEHSLYGGRFQWTTKTVMDFSSKSVGDVSHAIHAIIDDGMSTSEAFREMQAAVNGSHLNKVEKFFFYNELGRYLLLLTLSFTSTATFYNGTVIDASWAIVAGLIAIGVLAFDKHVMGLHGTTDFVVGVLVALFGVSVSASQNLCAEAIVLAPLIWFFYAAHLVMGLLEVFDGFIVNGVTRFNMAIIRTFGLALGASVGAYFADLYGGIAPVVLPKGVVRSPLLSDACVLEVDTGINSLILYMVLFPVLALAAQMHMRVGRGKMIATFGAQMAAWWSQTAMQAFAENNSIMASIGPAFVATMAGYIGVGIMRIRMTGRICQPLARVWDKYVLPAGKTASPWSVSLPALYLLLPGSGSFKGAFSAAVSYTGGVGAATAFASFYTALFIVGISIVIGINLGVFAYGVLSRAISWLDDLCSTSCFTDGDESLRSSGGGAKEAPMDPELGYSNWQPNGGSVDHLSTQPNGASADRSTLARSVSETERSCRSGSSRLSRAISWLDDLCSTSCFTDGDESLRSSGGGAKEAPMDPELGYSNWQPNGGSVDHLSTQPNGASADRSTLARSVSETERSCRSGSSRVAIELTEKPLGRGSRQKHRMSLDI
ncbi:hypothetical protein FOA52_006149 [Chlamydomonas sp. UWO 241]|nr:hypothetical protein FOA52_006149 [Chlamydomonas sp. UWO 241]